MLFYSTSRLHSSVSRLIFFSSRSVLLLNLSIFALYIEPFGTSVNTALIGDQYNPNRNILCAENQDFCAFSAYIFGSLYADYDFLYAIKFCDSTRTYRTRFESHATIFALIVDKLQQNIAKFSRFCYTISKGRFTALK